MRQEPSRQALLVLGMHRSGTSAFTRVLNLLGASLPTQLLPITADNVTGHWEPMEVVGIHDQVLASAASGYDDVTQFPQEWFASEAADVFRSQILDILKRDFSMCSLFILKDPRMCRLLPLWFPILKEFSTQPLFVIPIRNPLDVAASLKKRDGFSEDKSLLLWLWHFLSAERGTRGRKRSFVRYNLLLQDWRKVIHRIETDLDLRLTRTVEAEKQIDRFLNWEHRHHDLPDEELFARPNLLEWVRIAYAWAIDAAQSSPVNAGDLDLIYGELTQASRAFGGFYTELTKARSRIVLLQTEARALQAQANEYAVVRRTLAWRLLIVYWRTVDAALPLGTRRRRIYDEIFSFFNFN